MPEPAVRSVLQRLSALLEVGDVIIVRRTLHAASLTTIRLLETETDADYRADVEDMNTPSDETREEALCLSLEEALATLERKVRR